MPLSKALASATQPQPSDIDQQCMKFALDHVACQFYYIYTLYASVQLYRVAANPLKIINHVTK